MDLGAYAQIEDLEKIAKANGIEVSRCRGYRLMKNEKPIDKKEIDKIVQSNVFSAAESEIRTDKYGWVVSCYQTNKKVRKCFFGKKKDFYIDITGINWKNIHGKKRKRVKLAIKHSIIETTRQYELWNEYAGRDDVLYIHAKIGGANWSDITYKHYEKESWYLDGCDDSYDHVYCDIYAKIREE